MNFIRRWRDAQEDWVVLQVVVGMVKKIEEYEAWDSSSYLFLKQVLDAVHDYEIKRLLSEDIPNIAPGAPMVLTENGPRYCSNISLYDALKDEDEGLRAAAQITYRVEVRNLRRKIMEKYKI